MKDINAAYEAITKSAADGETVRRRLPPEHLRRIRRRQGYAGGDRAPAGALCHPDGEILAGREVLLAACSDHNAEWNFLKGVVCARRGWMDEAKRYYQTACQMDPDNLEYQRALDYMGKRPRQAYTPAALCSNGSLRQQHVSAYVLPVVALQWQCAYLLLLLINRV